MKHFDSLSQYMYAAGERGLFNGCWMLRKNSKVIESGAIGSRHPHHELPIGTDTLFDIASVSKQFTAAAILILRDRGMLSLDDSLDKYYPGTGYGKVTIYQMLTHTSGLPDFLGWMLEYEKEHGRSSGKEIIDGLMTSSRLPLQFEPGTVYCYCNTGFCVLGRIIEMVSGMELEDFLRENIFIPAGMDSTHVGHDLVHKPLDSRFAFGTVVENGIVYPVIESQGEAYTVDLPELGGDGGVVTSAEDLLQWDKALREGKVISPGSQEEMFTSCILPDGKETGYGLGWVLGKSADGKRIVSHTGRWAGFLSYFGRLPDEDSALVVLCNQYGADVNAWIEMEGGFEAFLCGETNVPEPQILDDKADWTEENMERLDSLKGEYMLDKEPIGGLFSQDLEIYEDNGKVRIKLVFMDTVFDSDLVPFPEGHFIERRGLFDFTESGGTLTTGMYDKDFTFVRK